MRCPECNTEIHDTKSRFCPNCGAPVNNGDSANEREQSRSESFSSANEREQTKGGSHDEPQLGRGMMIFIAVGLVVVIAYGIATYLYHRNDPEYTRTAIEPDSTLADKNTVKFDTLVPDTAKRDSIRRAEKRDITNVRLRRSQSNASESKVRFRKVKKSLFKSRYKRVQSYSQGYGGIAQLGEHLLCKQGVCGSIPHISTINNSQFVMRNA